MTGRNNRPHFLVWRLARTGPRASVGEQGTVAAAAGCLWALPSAKSRLSATPLRMLPMGLG